MPAPAFGSTDFKVFDAATREQSESILRWLNNFEEPYLKDDFYDELGDRAVEYLKYYGSVPHKNNPSLLR